MLDLAFWPITRDLRAVQWRVYCVLYSIFAAIYIDSYIEAGGPALHNLWFTQTILRGERDMGGGLAWSGWAGTGQRLAEPEQGNGKHSWRAGSSWVTWWARLGMALACAPSHCGPGWPSWVRTVRRVPGSYRPSAVGWLGARIQTGKLRYMNACNRSCWTTGMGSEEYCFWIAPLYH